MSVVRRAAALGLVAAGADAGALAGADSFTPIRLGLTVAPVARRHVKLPVTIQISADAGALDPATAPLRIQVKLAAECGGTYQYTPGTVLLDQALSPQPTKGRAYSVTAKGSAAPAFGEQTLCVWLNEEGEDRTFASDTSTQVNVSKRMHHESQPRRTDAASWSASSARSMRATTSSGPGARSGAPDARRRACGPGVRL